MDTVHWLTRLEERADEVIERRKDAVITRLRSNLPGPWSKILAMGASSFSRSGWTPSHACIFLELNYLEKTAFDSALATVEMPDFLTGLMDVPGGQGREFLEWLDDNEPDFSEVWHGGFLDE